MFHVITNIPVIDPLPIKITVFRLKRTGFESYVKLDYLFNFIMIIDARDVETGDKNMVATREIVVFFFVKCLFSNGSMVTLIRSTTFLNRFVMTREVEVPLHTRLALKFLIN